MVGLHESGETTFPQLSSSDKEGYKDDYMRTRELLDVVLLAGSWNADEATALLEKLGQVCLAEDSCGTLSLG